MKNVADIPTQTKWTAQASLESFGVNIPDSIFEEWAEWAIDAIGRNNAEVRIASKVRENGEVSLPCDVNSVEAVTLDVDLFEVWKGTKIDENGKTIEAFGSKPDYSPSSMDPYADYVDFKIVNSYTIKVSPSLKDSFVYIKATTLLVNDDNEVLFTNKQILALVEYIIALRAKRDYLSGNPTIDPDKAMLRAHKLIAASRVPVYVSDNEIDRILNVKVSFDRKMFNKDYKIND